MRSLYLWLFLLFSIIPSVSSAASTPTPVTNFRNYSTLQQLGAGPENTLLYKGRQIVAGGGGGSATVQNLTFQAGPNATITGNDDAKTVTFGVYSSPTFHDVIAKGPVVDARHPSFAGGVKWDNATDDTAALAAAIAAASAAGGGVVMLPKGTGISSPINLPSNVYLRGQGRYLTTIKLKAGSNDSLVKVNEQSHWGILDLTLDGNKANQTGASYGLWVHTVATHDPTPYVSNVFVQNCYSDGIHIDSGSQGGGYYSNVDAYSNDGIGIVAGSYDTTWHKCSAGQSGLQGISITASSNHLTDFKAWFSGRIDPASGDGIVVQSGISKTQCANCEAQDNQGHGVVMKSNSVDSAFTGLSANDNAQRGTGYGVYINGAKSSLVTGNSTANADLPAQQEYGLFVDGGAKGNIVRLTSSGNLVGIVGGASGDISPNDILVMDKTGALFHKGIGQNRDIYDAANTVKVNEFVQTGGTDATYRLDPIPATGGDGNIEYFRSTSTTGLRQVKIMKGDGTATQTIVLDAGTGKVSAQSVQINNTDVSNAPRMWWTAGMLGTLTSTSTSTVYNLTPSVPITLERIVWNVGTQGVSCTTPPVVSVKVAGGTSALQATVANATWGGTADAAVNVAAGQACTVYVTTAAAGCSTSPANAYIGVQYRMQ